MAVCRECALPVLWARSVNGVAVPLDKTPTLVGNIRLAGKIAHKVPAANLPIEGEDAYSCHFDTCSRKRHLTSVTGKPRCSSCALVMDPLVEPDQVRHPCC